MKNLEVLKISRGIFYDLKPKEASTLQKDLCGKKNLASASFVWTEVGSPRWTKVKIKKVNGEVVVSSGPKVWK